MDDLSIVGQIDQVAPPVAPPTSTVDHINAALAGVTPDQGRAAAWSQAVADAKSKWEQRGPLQQFGEFAEPMIPFSQIPGISPTQKWKEMVAESQKRIESGHYTDQDLGRAAYQHVRDEAEGRQGFGRKLLGAVGHAAGMLGEAALTGGVGELIPGASRAAGAARLAATTAAMPSLYGEAANQRAQAQGGSAYDLKNIGPAFAQGMILNKILGSMGKSGETLVSGKNLMGGIENGYVRNVARLGIGAVQFPAEQQIADNVTSTADLLLPEAYQFKTKYGVLGELVNGSKGEAGQKFAMQAVMGAIFKAVHAVGAERERKAAFAAELQRYNDKLESLARRGLSSQRVFDSATGEMGQEREAEVAQVTKQAPVEPQTAPEPTPSNAPPAAGATQPDTIAPPEGTSTPPAAPGASPAIAPVEQPPAQPPVGGPPTPPPTSPPTSPPVGAAPSKKLLKLLVDGGFAGSQAEAAAALAKLPPEMVEAVRAQFEGKPAPAPSPAAKKGGATYKQAEVEGPFVHADVEAGGPRLLAEMRASPEYSDIAKAVPEGSKPIGRPNDAFVFETPDGKIARVGRVSESRPDNPYMIQPESVRTFGRFKVEVLPKVERVGDKEYFDKHAAELRTAVEALGWKASDLHRDNVGEYQGRPVFVDPAGMRPMTIQEREKLAQAQAERAKKLAEAKPAEAPPEPATPPATDEAAAQIERIAEAPPPKPLSKEERSALMRRGRAAEKAGVDVAGDAKELGVRPEVYHAAAAFHLERANVQIKEHNDMLRDALDALDKYAQARGQKQSKARFMAANESRGGKVRIEDAAALQRDHIDDVAEQMARDYPDLFTDVRGDKTLLTDQLFDKLSEGRRNPDVAEAYRKAYDELWARKAPEVKDAQEKLGLTDDEAEAAIRDGVEHASQARPEAGEGDNAEATPGEADESNLTQSDSAADFSFGANAVDLGAAPTTLVGRLEALQDLTPFERAVQKNMLAEAAGEPFQSPEQIAKAHGKKGGRATALAAQQRLLKRAGEAEGTSWQDVRDREAASRAEMHKGEPEGMGQENRDGELSDQKYKQLLGQAKRGERMNPIEREKLLDRMATDIAEKKHAGGDIKADVELYAKIVEQATIDDASPSGISGGQENAPEGAPKKKPSLTALANEVADRERAKNGLPPLLRAARQANPETWDRAMSMLDRDPDVGRKLVEELSAKVRSTTVEENALLLHRKITLSNELERAMKEYLDARNPKNRAGFSAEQFDAMEKRFDDTLKQIDELDKVVRATGTEWGRAGQFRRQLAAEDYSLHGMLQKAAAAKGRPLTFEEQQQVADLHAKIKLLEKQLLASEERFRAEAGRAVENVGPGQRAEVVAASPALKDMLGLRAQTERAKGGFRQQLLRDTAARDPWSKRMSDFFVKLRQAFVISSPKTMAKIVVASAARIAIAPLEEAVGSAIRRIPGIAKIAALAPREGRGFSASREAKSFVSAFTEGMRDAWRTVRTGESDLDATYKPNADLRSWVDFVGDLHAAAKAPAVRAEYTRSFLSRLDAEAAKGVDISNPLVVHKAGIEAYRDSQRAKFQQDNAVVDLFNDAVKKARKPEAGAAMNAAGFGAKILMPVVRVPTNIVAEVGEYAFGTIIGSVKAARAWKLGIETLKPSEAEAIMRQLKKGSLGGAALLAGYLAPDVFGGFYNRDDKRKPGDLQHGEVMTPMGAAPNWTQHNPWLEVFQVGASARRVEDSLRKGKERGPLEGSVAAMLGLAQEVPFVRETTELGKAFDPRTGGHWFGEFMKSLAIPQAVQWLAGNLDRDSVSGEPNERKASTVGESIESGVPGLRSNVPLRKK